MPSPVKTPFFLKDPTRIGIFLRQIITSLPSGFVSTTALLFGILILKGSSQESIPVTAETIQTHSPHLPPSFFEISDRISTGAEPHSEEHFGALRKKGILTVVSVDGARPKAELARKYGLRYIHIPIGYDSVPLKTQAAMAQIIATKAGKIFIHCHHGKHRGPAAAAIAGRISGDLDMAASLKLLEQCGTSKNYPGLWDSIRTFSAANLKVTPSPLLEIAPVQPLASSMSEMDRIFDQLKAKPNEVNQKSDRFEQATLLHELFVESARHAKTDDNIDPKLARMLEQATHTTAKLIPAVSTKNRSAYDEVIKKIRTDCRACHREFRN